MNLANDYRALRPNSDEDRMSYALRLQKDGFEEMFIRKALRCHFQMKIEDFPVFFEGFEEARLGHVALLLQIGPNRSDYSLARKISKNLGIAPAHAEALVIRFRTHSTNSPE
ncbi:hypothetical protein [Rhodobacter sp. 24-YEA-8]|uniref:hypothetical protein n=1 Tax=Rhodobacter sp. 24-YEA-8 TaxID=1884310 RepID=UPI00089443EF|nr:hypothetical protein [Rhodobacter sp. 24-YEA-8]SEB67870.1 hypothetical protein SAMN05519105_1071 [Rhodobacter sp. 24-YEA-8]